MSLKSIKSTSFVLLALATVLIVLRIINFKMVAVSNAGLWDFLPTQSRKVLFFSYPVLMVSSGVLYIISRKEKTRFDVIIPALYLLNLLIMVFVLVVLLVTLVQKT